MLELLRRKPAGMRLAPILASAKDPAMAQQEREKLLALLTQILARGAPNAYEIAHRFMHCVGNPNPCQLPRPQQPRQGDRIAPVCFNALARTLGD